MRQEIFLIALSAVVLYTIYSILGHITGIIQSLRSISQSGGKKTGEEGKRQAINAISEFKQIPPAPLSNGGTVVKSWLVTLYRVVKNKMPDMNKQDIAIELVARGDKEQAEDVMSTGSTVPASALWMIFENLVRMEIKKVLFLLVLVIIGVASLVFTIENPS